MRVIKNTAGPLDSSLKRGAVETPAAGAAVPAKKARGRPPVPPAGETALESPAEKPAEKPKKVAVKPAEKPVGKPKKVTAKAAAKAAKAAAAPAKATMEEPEKSGSDDGGNFLFSCTSHVSARVICLVFIVDGSSVDEGIVVQYTNHFYDANGNDLGFSLGMSWDVGSEVVDFVTWEKAELSKELTKREFIKLAKLK